MEHATHPGGLFRDDVEGDADKVLVSEAQTNEYIAHLNTLLPSIDTKEGRQVVADYGIQNVGKDEDLALASYFFVVSSLKALSPTARDFFTEVMVYCEDKMGELKNTVAIKERYEKEIRPAL
jgi:hypothetical protein